MCQKTPANIEESQTTKGARMHSHEREHSHHSNSITQRHNAETYWLGSAVVHMPVVCSPPSPSDPTIHVIKKISLISIMNILWGSAQIPSDSFYGSWGPSPAPPQLLCFSFNSLHQWLSSEHCPSATRANPPTFAGRQKCLGVCLPLEGPLGNGWLVWVQEAHLSCLQWV